MELAKGEPGSMVVTPLKSWDALASAEDSVACSFGESLPCWEVSALSVPAVNVSAPRDSLGADVGGESREKVSVFRVSK